jgi:hypothetical protein
MKNFILLVVLTVSGCCTWCPDKIKEVYVNTGCTQPASVVAPTLKTSLLDNKSTSKEVIEAYVLDVGQLKLYCGQLSKALEPYKSCQNK